MSMDPEAHFETLCQRRDNAQNTLQQLQGRLSAAKDDVNAIEKECADRGVPPEQLEAAITKLTKRYNEAVSAFEEKVTSAEALLKSLQES